MFFGKAFLWFLIASALAAGVAAAPGGGVQPVIWSAPRGEMILCVRAGKNGHLVVLSAPRYQPMVLRDDDPGVSRRQWLIRDIDLKGHARLLMSGRGQLNVTEPMSQCDWQHGRVLLGMHPLSSSVSYGVADCDLARRTVHQLSDFNRIYLSNIVQPYSPDGRSTVVFGSRPGVLRDGSVWLLTAGGRKPARTMWGERRNSYYVGWVKDGRLLVFDGTEGSVYAGKPANLQMLRCKLAPTAYNGSFSPDGNRLIADYFDRKHPNRVHFVYMYDLKTGERRLLYRGPSLPYPAEWSDDGKYAMVVLSGEGERPLVVGPDGKVRRAQITSISSKASTIPDSWLACSAGGVFLSPDLIACVEQEKKGNAERIVRVAILGNDER